MRRARPLREVAFLLLSTSVHNVRHSVSGCVVGAGPDLLLLDLRRHHRGNLGPGRARELHLLTDVRRGDEVTVDPDRRENDGENEENRNQNLLHDLTSLVRSLTSKPGGTPSEF